MYYIITYDIPDDRRRSRLAKALLDFGDRVQFSVFEARLNNKLYSSMMERVATIINGEEDNVRVYPICQQCDPSVTLLGDGPAMEKTPDVWIL